jgi:hypothetical protein
MLDAQHNGCKLCGEPLVNFVIDHDHACCSGRRSCGKCVRGLLCVSCNAGLGQLARLIRIGMDKVLDYIKAVA